MRKSSPDLTGPALDALPVALLLVDLTGRVDARNRVAGELLADGDALADVLACTTDNDMPVDWVAELADLAELAGPTSLAAIRLACPDSSVRLVDVHLAGLEGKHDKAIVLVQDVTDRVSMERRLATSERLAAVGKLAARVAHELNNPLDGILRYIGLAERADDAEQRNKCLQQARGGLTRMAGIIADLLDFSRSAGTPTKVCTVTGLIDQALEAMSPAVRAAGVSVVCDLDDGQGSHVPGTLFQVLCNLLKNATDAMPKGGRLTITSRRVGDQVQIALADTGPGIDPELLGQVFEPFFSTKGHRKGTGLGLSISRDIVQHAGGRIIVDNGPEGGAVFRLTVPLRAGSTSFTA